MVIPHKRLITPLDRKMALALRVAAKKPALGVARCLFGMTKLHSSRLDCWVFSRNSLISVSVNKP